MTKQHMNKQEGVHPQIEIVDPAKIESPQAGGSVFWFVIGFRHWGKHIRSLDRRTVRLLVTAGVILIITYLLVAAGQANLLAEILYSLTHLFGK